MTPTRMDREIIQILNKLHAKIGDEIDLKSRLHDLQAQRRKLLVNLPRIPKKSG